MKIEIYPECPKPKWIKAGVRCYCWGEAYDIYTIGVVGQYAATLIDSNGCQHGWESFNNLHQYPDK